MRLVTKLLQLILNLITVFTPQLKNMEPKNIYVNKRCDFQCGTNALQHLVFIHTCRVLLSYCH